MRTSTYALLAAALSALAQETDDPTSATTDAIAVTDNPINAKYVAVLEGAITGRALAGSDGFGLGVSFHVFLDGLPENEGPYNYYIHQLPVPEDGDCTGTGGHLDPFGRRADPPCDDGEPQSCEVGDLSGKHGTVDGPTDQISFIDPYASLTPDTPAFLGGGSFVVYNAAGDWIACASFRTLAEGEDPFPQPAEPPSEPPLEDEENEEEEETDEPEDDLFGPPDEEEGDDLFGPPEENEGDLFGPPVGEGNDPDEGDSDSDIGFGDDGSDEDVDADFGIGDGEDGDSELGLGDE